VRAAEGLRVARALAGALRSQWLPPEALRGRQERALAAQLAHAARTVPHYRGIFAERGLSGAGPALETLAALPILRRERIQERPEAFLAEDGERDGWHSSRTSGSTGRPLVTFFDAPCWAQVKLALKLRRLLASGWRPGRRLMVVETLTPEELASHAARAAWPLERALGARAWLSVFEPPESHLARYWRARPHFLYAPPSYLAELAPHWDGALRRRVPLRALMTSSEWTPLPARERLRRAFGVPLLDVYGSTEFKEIAWQCTDGSGYHVNVESVFVEVLDEAGAPVPDGAPGELVVTSLTNRAMPLLRYGTGDRASRRPGRCPCGRGAPLLDAIEGRVADFVHVGGRSLSPYELTTAIEHHPGLRQYRFVQRAPDRIEVEVVLADSAAELVAIERDLRRRLGPEVEVAVRPVAAIPRRASGKLRVVEADPLPPGRAEGQPPGRGGAEAPA
jgi:phenylacetate-CoA ligase